MNPGVLLADLAQVRAGNFFAFFLWPFFLPPADLAPTKKGIRL